MGELFERAMLGQQRLLVAKYCEQIAVDKAAEMAEIGSLVGEAVADEIRLSIQKSYADCEPAEAVLPATCAGCKHWDSVVPGEGASWGKCGFAHQRIFVKLPDELNVRQGEGVLLTLPDFCCGEFEGRK